MKNKNKNINLSGNLSRVHKQKSKINKKIYISKKDGMIMTAVLTKTH